MRIYDIGNKGGTGFWCAAPDPETAITIAFEAKHAKSRANLHAEDVTDRFLAHDPTHHDRASIEAILTGTATGRVVGLLHAFRFDEVLDAITKTGKGPTGPKTRWVIRP